MTPPMLRRSDLGREGEQRPWLGREGGVLKESGHDYYSVRALAEGMAAYDRRLLDVCAARQIDCIDLASEFPPTLEMFYDDAHLTEKGATTVAESVSEHLTRLMLPQNGK